MVNNQKQIPLTLEDPKKELFAVPNDFTKNFTKNFDDNGYPVLNPRWVGIVNFSKNSKQKYFGDKKLFVVSEEDVQTDYLLQLYKHCRKNLNEGDSLKNSLIPCYNEENFIKLDSGKYDEFLPYFFEKEIIKIIKSGLLKSYESRNDNLIFARGKINFKEQIYNTSHKSPRISCIFNELVVNNYENKIILYACYLLARKNNLDPSLKSDFLNYSNLFLGEGIDLEIFLKNQFKGIDKIQKRYRPAIELAYSIINREHLATKTSEKINAPSFILNAAAIWESFLRVCIREIFKKEYDVKKGEGKLHAFNFLNDIIGYPDIVITKKNDSNKYYILDAKYKCDKTNPDLYQLAAYLGSEYSKHPGERGYLLYLGNIIDEDNSEKDEDIPGEYVISTKGMQEKIPLKIIYLYGDLVDCTENGEIKIDKFSKVIYKKILDEQANH